MGIDMQICISIAATAFLLYGTCSNLVAQQISDPLLSTEDHPATEVKKPANSGGEQDEFYAPNRVQTLHLKIAESDQQKMKAALPECIYVPAVLNWNNQTVREVGVRFKGNSSANPHQQHKRSYLIKFSKYKKQQRFLGMERISFDNGVQFGSLFSEPIITDILLQLGHPTHRCNYAKLYVNNEFTGVYVNAERIDDTFIQRHFPGKPGGLWKNDTGGPGGDLRYIGDDPQLYRKAFEPKNKQAETDSEVRELLTFIEKINRIPDENFEQMLAQNIDVDKFLQTTAVMLLSGAFDQLTGWGPHNYYLYRQNDSGNWHYLPWDLDVGFCEIAFGKVYALEDWNAAWPIPKGHQNPLLDRLIRNPDLLARYRAIALDILETHFNPEQLCKTLDSKYALIREDLKKDPYPNRRATVSTDQSYDDIIDSMKQFIRKRYKSARNQLLNPGTRPTTSPRSGTPGPPLAIMQRFQKSIGKAEAIQRRLHEIQRTVQKTNRALQQQQYEQAEELIELIERLTEEIPMNDAPR